VRVVEQDGHNVLWSANTALWCEVGAISGGWPRGQIVNIFAILEFEPS